MRSLVRESRIFSVAVALSLSGCMGELTIDPAGGQLGYGSVFDERQADAVWLEIAAHESWTGFMGQESLIPSTGAHAAFQQIFVNDKASENPAELQYGAVIVARNYTTEDRSVLESITVMKRIRNFAPDAGDWFWAEYTPTGYVALDEQGFSLAGAIGRENPNSCIGCHQNAPGSDLVYRNGPGEPVNPGPTGPKMPPADHPYGQSTDLERAGTLWAMMAGHDAWPGFPGRDGIQPIETPHSTFVSFHLNDVAVQNTNAPGDGAIIATRNYRTVDDPASIESVTVMNKMPGYNPEQGDWFWAKFKPTGELVTDEQGYGLAGAIGKGQTTGCLSCHQNAPGGDFIHANEEQ